MTPQDNEKLPWERMQHETPKAFAAFCIYRDMGPDRSLVKAYREHTGRQARVAPGRWKLWSGDYEWTNRAREYDLHLELKARAAREEAHSADLEAYRKRQQNLATATTQSSLQLLQIANARMADLLAEYKAWKARYDAAPTEEDKRRLKKDDPLNLGSLPNLLRAAAATAQVATDAEAQALAVNELLKILEDTKTKI